jgi:Rhodanese-like domain
MGGLIGAMVIGLGLVIFLIINNNNSNTPTVTNPGTTTGGNTPAPVGSTAPRMTMAEFKALYDNPATRPVILDVRTGQSFNEGHIAGAISVPEAEVDILLAKIPKDKLVVAYCQ